ncbi:MAG: hypothetical protein QM516_12680 [Limnohabitans sp.]|jgi:hypothetical protein|nr:hypothetical protein [Limnohabitans sp.]
MNMIRQVLLGSAIVFVAASFCGCAAGSATAGYSIAASTADDLKSEARTRIIQEAVSQSKASLAEDLKLEREAILREAKVEAAKEAEAILNRAVERLVRESREAAEDYIMEQIPKIRQRILKELENQGDVTPLPAQSITPAPTTPPAPTVP